jgi:predicted Zn-dependent protease
VGVYLTNLHKFHMKLNPKKCVFGLSSEKLLGYIVSTRRIDANPKKVEAIKKLHPPQMWKEIQKLADMMATLSWFICKSRECVMPFYKMLRKADTF